MSRRRFALVSDLDGTLLGDDIALAEFADVVSARRSWLRLVYNTGRFHESVRELFRTTKLPIPDAIIGGVGAEIWVDDQRVETWPAARNWSADAVAGVVARFAELQPQPDEFQSPWKRSYYAHHASDALLRAVGDALTAAGLSVNIVYSSSRDLDVLPNGVDKGSAANHLISMWGLAPKQVVVAGDTANDLALFEREFLGITVGNAHPVLRRIDGPCVYHARRPHAGGVVEGLIHWLGE